MGPVLGDVVDLDTTLDQQFFTIPLSIPDTLVAGHGWPAPDQSTYRFTHRLPYTGISGSLKPRPVVRQLMILNP